MNALKSLVLACAAASTLTAAAQMSPQQMNSHRPVQLPQVPRMPQGPQGPVFQPTNYPQPMPVYQPMPINQPPMQGYQPPMQAYGLTCYAGNAVGQLSQPLPVGVGCQVFVQDGSVYYGTVGQ
jgi:hypothetical protein